MRILNILVSSWAVVGLVVSSPDQSDRILDLRQENSNSAPLPTLGASTVSVSPSASATTAAANTQSSAQPTSAAASTGSRASDSITSSNTARSSTIISDSIGSTSSVVATTTPTPTATSANNSTSTLSHESAAGLPLQPRITPALSVGGVILLLTGIVYALIGVKNRWAHIFLSTAYLTSLSICVLIVYVMNPPVSNAIQGAYFVGIFMTGVIFGAGALIFKEVTEGLGCLLGGFTLSMWFLTLKEGGLITSTGGKAIFIAVFCVLAWSLSFSHYTRAYGLMASTAFSGATAFVLGIDCFSRGGLKEFWLYIWGLNEGLFPINTNTYPISRGTRVETVVIVLACIIGVISQLKLWKVVQDRQQRKDAEQKDEERRRDVVEAALGRHLERQNDRDRSQWEKQYGDRLNAKRETILWTDTLGEKKRSSRVMETEVGGSQRSDSSESLEMSNMSKRPRSVYVGRMKRQSNMAIDQTIKEVEEGDNVDDSQQQSAAGQLQDDSEHAHSSIPTGTADLDHMGQGTEVASQQPLENSQDPQNSTTASNREDKSPVVESQQRGSTYEQHLTAPDHEQKKKRLSWSSMFSSRSAKDKENGLSREHNDSQEALMIPGSTLRHSRASSLAATLDFENEILEFPSHDAGLRHPHSPPDILISPVGQSKSVTIPHDQYNIGHRDIDRPPSPPALTENFELDPEEFVRPPVKDVSVADDQGFRSGSRSTKRRSGPQSDSGTETLEGGSKSQTKTSDTLASEILTKGALDQIPNHLSNVVMSYRTNEWAKHIATAEAPVYEEPQTIEEEDAETPAHLADPEELQTPIAEPPPINDTRSASGTKSPIEAAIPSSIEGIRVNPAVQPVQSYSVGENVAVAPRVRSISDVNQLSTSQGVRSASSPLLKQGFQTSQIDETGAMNLPPRQSVMRSVSSQSFNQVSGRGSPAMNRPSVSGNNFGQPMRNASHQSLVMGHSPIPARSQSQLGNYPQLLPSRSETRLASYESHQPQRRHIGLESQRREAMFTDWRMSQQRGAGHEDQAEMQRQQMLIERQHMKAMEEQEKNMKLQHSMAIDARMRGRDMQELHRDAMRRMQANANKGLGEK